MDNSIKLNYYLYYTQLAQLLTKNKHKEIILFCVGNYKVWYDSFSSALAYTLRQLNLNCFIYGGTDFPILPENLEDYISFVKHNHPNSCIIVVDNILTFNQSECGELVISPRVSQIAYFSKNLAFGDISVLYKTFPYAEPYLMLKKQFSVVNMLKNVFKILINNRLIV